MRLQAAADAAEAIFHHVRFASGAPASGYGGGTQRHASTVVSGALLQPSSVAGEGVTSPGGFEPPDPEPIVERFAALDRDVAAVRILLTTHSVYYATSRFPFPPSRSMRLSRIWRSASESSSCKTPSCAPSSRCRDLEAPPAQLLLGRCPSL